MIHLFTKLNRKITKGITESLFHQVKQEILFWANAFVISHTSDAEMEQAKTRFYPISEIACPFFIFSTKSRTSKALAKV